MTERSIVHATFTLERTYPASPARVFKAFSDPVAKAKWFNGPPDWSSEAEIDFRVGGREINNGGPPGGPISYFTGIYQDIVPNERIVYSYDMRLNDTRISVSLTTIELKPAGSGTRLVLTEMGAYLDGYDDAGKREEGTGWMLDMLGASLEG